MESTGSFSVYNLSELLKQFQKSLELGDSCFIFSPIVRFCYISLLFGTVLTHHPAFQGF